MSVDAWLSGVVVAVYTGIVVYSAVWLGLYGLAVTAVLHCLLILCVLHLELSYSGVNSNE